MAQNDPEFVEMIVVLVIAGIAFTIGIGIQVFTCWVTAKTAAAIPPQFREIEPGMVWLLLIPCFAIVWNFFVFPKIASGYQRYFAATGNYHNGDCGASVALWYCLCVVFSMIPYLGAIPGIASFVLLIVMLVKFWGLKAQAESGPAVGFNPPYATPSFPVKKIDPTNPYA